MTKSKKKIDDEVSLDKEPNWWLRSILAVLIILFIVAGYGYFVHDLISAETRLDIGRLGSFGDTFGALTALFSGLAFAILIVTILMQSDELRLQRKELKLQHKEMKRQRGELGLTRDTMQLQNFESTFFQMLRLHNDIVSTISVEFTRTNKPVTQSGRECFDRFTHLLRNRYIYCRQQQSISIDHILQDEFEVINIAYPLFWNVHKQTLGHYFRYLYRIFVLVDESEVEDKLHYTDIVRAQLSDKELLLMFYNCLSEHGVDKFKPLVEKYELFDNLPRSLLFSEHHNELYALSAWGNNQSDRTLPADSII